MPNLFENANYQAGDQTALTASLNSGHQWAMDQANLDIKRQQTQMQLQQAQDMHQEFQSKMDSQMVGEYKDWAGMVPGKLKDTLADQWQDKWTRAGRLPKDSWVAAAKDPTYSPQVGKILGALLGPQFTPDVQDAVNQTIGNIASEMGRNDFTEKTLVGADQALAAMNAAKVRGQYMLEATDKRNQQSDTNNIRSTNAKFAQLDASNAKSGQQTYDKAVGPITFALDGALRAKGLIEQAQDPNTPPEKKVALTKQIRSVLSNEEARLVTGKQNFGEGTAANMSVDTYLARAKDLISKIDENPKDTLSDDNLKQMGNFYDELSGAYMEAHDRMANSKLGGALPAQRKAIVGRAQALQKQYGKKFGAWKGPGLETGDEGSASPSGGGSPNGAPAQPAASPAAVPGAQPPAQSAVGGAGQPAQVDPVQMQKAGQIYQTYLKLKQTDQVKAGLILQKMRQTFPDAIKQRLGIQ